jgi:hypothetical protein
MARKPEPARLAFVFGMVLAMAVTILAITTWAGRHWAAPIPATDAIYRPQHLNLY